MDVEKYLSNFFKGTKTPNLKGMRFLMDELSHPENDLKIIHIAGTNGKGSVTEMITNVLIKEGYNVGKFISPHLVHYNERISINNNNITSAEMEKIINEIKPVIDKYNSNNEIPITFFELVTTMSFLYFKQKQCDFVVLETGLGGLYDCTNIINHPLVSIITSIGYDHMHILGDTLPKIAFQKAGIIKPNSHTVIFESQQDVDNIFIEKCNKENNIIHTDEIENIRELFRNVQVKNACLCIETFNILNKLGYNISLVNIKEGLSSVIHKGRMEKLNNEPLIIYDGAHNEPAIKNLQDMVKMYYSKIKKVYIISILKRKDYINMLKLIAEDKEAIFILTSGDDTETFASNDELFECMKQFTPKNRLYKKSLNEAIEDALKSESDTVNFVVGSFYIYGSVINIINNK